MGRLEKNNVDYFPKWKPQFGTKMRLDSMDENLAFKTFRNTSSAFISNKYVRSYIFNKYKNKCNYCDL